MSAGGSRNHSYLNADQLHVHAYGLPALLHASFQDMRDPKLLCYLRQVCRRALVMPRGVREITFKSAIFDKRVRISSWIPSAK